MALNETLLALAGAAAADGGAAVVRTLAAALERLAPHDAGELAVADGVRLRRLGFSAEPRPLVANDLVRHASSRGLALRFDDLAELEAFPRTSEQLSAAGLRSLLVLPVRGSNGPDGVVALARHFGWAFVAAPLRELEALAAMAGVALAKSLALTELEQELAALGQNRRVLEAGLETARARGSEGERELERLEARCAAQAAELERLEARCAAQATELEQLAGRCARQAAELEQLAGRSAGQAGELEQLEACSAQQAAELERLREALAGARPRRSGRRRVSSGAA